MFLNYLSKLAEDYGQGENHKTQEKINLGILCWGAATSRPNCENFYERGEKCEVLSAASSCISSKSSSFSVGLARSDCCWTMNYFCCFCHPCFLGKNLPHLIVLLGQPLPILSCMVLRVFSVNLLLAVCTIPIACHEHCYIQPISAVSSLARSQCI